MVFVSGSQIISHQNTLCIKNCGEPGLDFSYGLVWTGSLVSSSLYKKIKSVLQSNPMCMYVLTFLRVLCCYDTRRPIKWHHSFCSILMSHCLLRGSGTDSKDSDVNTATIPVIAELLELLFLSDQHISVCPISISINCEFLIC